MRHLKHCKVKSSLANSKGISLALLFDYDGTLAPIVPKHTDANVSAGTRRWLKRLARDNHLLVGIITGRRYEDIYKRLPLKGALYSGNHGFEIYKDGACLLIQNKKWIKPMAKLGECLEEKLSCFPGVVVEKKEFSVTVHYRQALKQLFPEILRLARKTARPVARRYDWQITGGKMILEVRPSRHWNKGKAIRWIKKNLAPDALTIFVGDDVTDEDGFKALGRRGVSVRMKYSKNSAASYYVNSLEELKLWMDERVLMLKKKVS